jgi:hypothetical protein
VDGTSVCERSFLFPSQVKVILLLEQLWQLFTFPSSPYAASTHQQLLIVVDLLNVYW